MSYKLRLWISFIIILALAWTDYQLFDEGEKAHDIAEQTRRIAHLIILAGITLVGYFGWYAHPQRWIRKLWLYAYLTCFIVIFLVGILQVEARLFTNSFLDSIYTFRIFFGGPLPFLILYIFSVIGKKIPLLQEQDGPIK